MKYIYNAELSLRQFTHKYTASFSNMVWNGEYKIIYKLGNSRVAVFPVFPFFPWQFPP